MKFERSSWRKLYVAESIQHRSKPIFTRGLRDYLLRFAEGDGTLLHRTADAGTDLARVLGAVGAERKLVAAAVKDLLELEYLSLEGGRLWITKFADAQEARSSGAKRQAAYKERKRGGDVVPINSSARIPCPPDLALTSEQRGALETSLIPAWAIDALTVQFVAKSIADSDDKRSLVAWRKSLSTMISGCWNDPKKRPKEPAPGESPRIVWDG